MADEITMNEALADLNNLFVEVGGVKMTGFADAGIDLPSLPDSVVSSTGVDSVMWIKKHFGSLELEPVMNFQPNSKSIKILKGFELTGAVVPVRIEFPDIGLYFEALEGVVRETGNTQIGGSAVSDTVFTLKCKNFVSLKGL